MAQQLPADLRRMSHAYIVSAGSLGAAEETARALAAAAVCSADGPGACGVCRHCRKALAGIHPDIITVRRLVDDKGREKREISVDQIRALAADAYVLPNEAARKVYILLEADAMNASAQNAALKLLEEPPAGVLLLLCTVNPEQLLPTVRSRCVELSANGEAQPDLQSRSLAGEFLAAAASGDKARLYAWCAANEGMDTRAAAAFIDSAFLMTADMLCAREASLGMEGEELARLSALLSRCGAYLKFNTGVKHIFGLLAVRAGVEERKLN